MHGYETGEVTPTTELVLSHKHPDDAPGVAALIEDVRRHGRAFSSRHRIIDTAGRVRVVVVVGDLMRDHDGRVLGTEGFYVDITHDYETDVRGAVDDAVADLAENRIAIEQAKTIMMLAYGITAERAFEVLVWRSQETNTKVRALATQFVRDVLAMAPVGSNFARQIDQLLLSAHLQHPPAPPTGG